MEGNPILIPPPHHHHQSNGQLFDGLRVKVLDEIIPMGIDPGLTRE
jgi:hypothetical protein